MDWVTIIRKEARTSSILRTDELARKYGVVSPAVTQALARQEQKGLVQHISNKVYYNWLAQDGSPRDLVSVLRKAAYISLESGLREYGISTQSPRTLTCVTTGRQKEFKAGNIAISYRSITPRLQQRGLTGFVHRLCTLPKTRNDAVPIVQRTILA